MTTTRAGLRSWKLRGAATAVTITLVVLGLTTLLGWGLWPLVGAVVSGLAVARLLAGSARGAAFLAGYFTVVVIELGIVLVQMVVIAAMSQ